MILDFVATSTASCAANFVTHPFETAKVRQVLGQSGNVFSVMSRIVGSEGPGALYRGFNSSLLRAVVSGGGRQTVYWGLKSLLLANDDPSLSKRIVLGAGAGMIAAGAAAPIDMVRTRSKKKRKEKKRKNMIFINLFCVHCRQQAFKGTGRLGMWFLLKSAYAEGGVRGVYVGSSAVFARQALLTGSQLAFYDRSKVIVQSVTGLHVESFAVECLSSGVAGAAATLAIAPVESIKTQMQARGSGRSFRQTAKLIFTESGILGFWRGSFALWLKLAPHTVIVLTGTDFLRKAFGIPILL